MRAAFGRMTMCHMIANDTAELHAMADRIGVARRWFQGDHYDIALSKRRLAVAAGATEISWREAGLMMGIVRRGGRMPLPEMAEAELTRIWELIRFRDLNDAIPIDGDIELS
jgi:hypothetical protein